MRLSLSAILVLASLGLSAPAEAGKRDLPPEEATTALELASTDRRAKSQGLRNINGARSRKLCAHDFGDIGSRQHTVSDTTFEQGCGRIVFVKMQRIIVT